MGDGCEGCEAQPLCTQSKEIAAECPRPQFWPAFIAEGRLIELAPEGDDPFVLLDSYRLARLGPD